MTTDTSFDPPVAAGEEITVKCPDGFINQGSETITCQNGIHFKYDIEPRCEPQGKVVEFGQGPIGRLFFIQRFYPRVV